MLVTRSMLPNDWEKVAEVDNTAFNSYAKRTGRDITSQLRNQNNLQASLAINPSGCFVATYNDIIVGYIFSRFWGKIGWIGTFGINPDFHGQGIGQKLLTKAVNSLEASGCTTIGLETMPDSPYNVGLYARFGFAPIYPTIHLIKPSGLISSNLSVGFLSNLDEQEVFSHVTSISQAISPDLDYVKEAQNAKKCGWGETTLFGWPRPWGFAIVKTIASRGELPESICEIVAMVLLPKSQNQLGEVLQFLQNYAHTKKASQVSLPVNAINNTTLQEVLASGYRVNRVMLRMVYRGIYKRAEGIEMSRWAM